MLLNLCMSWALAGTPVDLSTADPTVWTPWMEERRTAAKAGAPEVVRIPVTFHGPYGCVCPKAYVGTSLDRAFTDTGQQWLSVTGMPVPTDNRLDEVYLVEGHFTGDFVAEDLRNPDGEPAEWLYSLEAFVVERFRAMEPTGPALAEVILTGAEAKVPVDLLKDERRFLVMAGSFGRGDPLAHESVERLKKAGFSEAESFDSRRAASLFSGFEVVVAGRYATEAEAKALIKRVQKVVPDAHVLQGW